jgi:flagellar biosynthesis regulator FlaF
MKKSLARLTTTLGIVGTTLLVSGLTQLKAIALPAEQVLQKLNQVPVFTIADEKGALLVGSVKKEDNTDVQIAQVFFSHKKAEKTFSDLQSQNPELAKKVRIFLISLGEVYQVQNKPENENKINIAYVPSDEAVTSAKTILDSSGQEYRSGVPLFFATVGEKQLSLTDDKGNFPFFFDKKQLEQELQKFKQQKPDLAKDIKIEVVPLEGIIQTLKTQDSEMLTKLRLVPSTESVEFIRQNIPEQGGATQPTPVPAK